MVLKGPFQPKLFYCSVKWQELPGKQQSNVGLRSRKLEKVQTKARAGVRPKMMALDSVTIIYKATGGPSSTERIHCSSPLPINAGGHKDGKKRVQAPWKAAVESPEELQQDAVDMRNLRRPEGDQAGTCMWEKRPVQVTERRDHTWLRQSPQ